MPETNTEPEASTFIELLNLRRAEKLAMAGLILVMFSGLVNLIMHFFYAQFDLYLYRRIGEMRFEDTGLSIAYWGSILIYIFAAITFGNWIYKVFKNLQDSGLRGMKYSPITATLWMLVPGANLYFGLPVMREAFQGSKALGGEVDQWFWSRSKTGRVDLWFAFWIGRVAFYIILLASFRSENAELILSLHFVFYVVDMMGALFCLQVVYKISRAHHRPLAEWADWDNPPHEVVEMMPHIYGQAEVPAFVKQAYHKSATQPQQKRPLPTDWPGKSKGFPMPRSWGNEWRHSDPMKLPQGPLVKPKDQSNSNQQPPHQDGSNPP